MRNQATPTKTKLASLQQLEAEYGVPYRSLRDLVLRGFLPRVQLGDSVRIWVKRSDFEALVERSRETTAA